MVRIRLSSWWYAVRESLWFLPALLTLAGALLAVGLVQLDRALAVDPTVNHFWVFSGGAAGARGVLQAIAGSLITVTGTVFSITIVALQLASSQFTPRVLGTFTRDRGVQLVLGVFIGTFTYSLLVLRAVQDEDSDFERFIPGIAVIGAIVLALVSVGFLIYFIHHMAQSIRVSAVVERVGRDGERLIGHRFPMGIGDPLPIADRPTVASTLPAAVTADRAGYLQTIGVDELFGLACETDLTIQIEPEVGAYLLQGEPLASIWPAAAVTDDLVAAVRRSCVLGRERTLEADVDLPLHQLADIAVKALSPGINDPTTALICVDRLAELLVRAGDFGSSPPAYRRMDSAVCLVIRAPSFDRLTETAFAQIRHYGADNPTVAAHVIGVLGRVARVAPPVCRPALRHQGALLLAAARARISLHDERLTVEAAAAWLALDVIDSATGENG